MLIKETRRGIAAGNTNTNIDSRCCAEPDVLLAVLAGQ